MAFQPKGRFVSVTINDKKAINLLTRYEKNLPNMNSNIQKEFGTNLQKQLRRTLTTEKLVKSKYLYNNTKWVQRKNKGWLRMPRYGVALDSMKPHFVKFTNNRRRFLSWGLKYGNPTVKAKARRAAAGVKHGVSIYVRPHPWIRKPTRRAITRLPKIIKKNLNKLGGK